MALLNKNKFKIGAMAIQQDEFTSDKELTTAILFNNDENRVYLLISSECNSDVEERKYMSDVYNILRYLNHQAKIFDQRIE